MRHQLRNPFGIGTVALFPRRCFTSRALITQTSSSEARIFHTGFQYTPVLSMAAIGQPSSTSQSAKATRSLTVVPNSRLSTLTAPCAIDASQAGRHTGLMDVQTTTDSG